MAISTRPIGNVETPEDLVKIIKEVFLDLEDQLNNRAQVYVSTNGRAPAGLNKNDVLIIAFRGQISILIKSGTTFQTLLASMLGGLMANGTNFIGLKTDSIAPSIVHFPEDNDWGFFNRTGGSPAFLLVYNIGGAIKSQALT